MGVMARYEQTYSGERRTAALHVQLTPAERAHIEGAAFEAGSSSISQFAREYLLRRMADAPRVATVRRNPEARRLAFELSAIGNNLNQLARLANATGIMVSHYELRAVIEVLKAAMAHVLSL
jgi:hypothetical protein